MYYKTYVYTYLILIIFFCANKWILFSQYVVYTRKISLIFTYINKQFSLKKILVNINIYHDIIYEVLFKKKTKYYFYIIIIVELISMQDQYGKMLSNRTVREFDAHITRYRGINCYQHVHEQRIHNNYGASSGRQTNVIFINKSSRAFFFIISFDS